MTTHGITTKSAARHNDRRIAASLIAAMIALAGGVFASPCLAAHADDKPEQQPTAVQTAVQTARQADNKPAENQAEKQAEKPAEQEEVKEPPQEAPVQRGVVIRDDNLQFRVQIEVRGGGVVQMQTIQQGRVNQPVGLPARQQDMPGMPGFPGGTAWGEDTEIVPVEFDALIDALGHSEYVTREQALLRLTDHPGVTLERLETALGRDELTLEQRLRIEQLALTRFAVRPRGAMGVSFPRTLLRDRVIIENTYEQFDSHEKLRVGDLVAEVDGIRTFGPDALLNIRSRVFSRQPGDSVPMVIYRNGERIELELTLGEYGNLPGGGSLAAADLARAWRARCERLGIESHIGGAAQAAAVPAPSGGWNNDAMRSIRQDPANAQARQTGRDTFIEPVAGGVARSGIVHPDDFEKIRQSDELQMRMALQRQAVQQRNAPFRVDRDRQIGLGNMNPRDAMTLEEELAAIEHQAALLRIELEQMASQLRVHERAMRGDEPPAKIVLDEIAVITQRQTAAEQLLERLTLYRASIVAEARDRGDQIPELLGMSDQRVGQASAEVREE